LYAKIVAQIASYDCSASLVLAGPQTHVNDRL